MFSIIVVDGGDEENDEDVMKLKCYIGDKLQRFLKNMEDEMVIILELRVL